MWVISTTENSNKFQKTRFWKEKSTEDVRHNTLANGISHITEYEHCNVFKCRF
jgi:hypothetical protein